MERVKPGDIVFHFTDSKGFTGVSIADSEVDREWTDVPPNTKRSDRDAYFLVKLKCYEKLTPRLDRAEIFDNGEVWQQLLNILTEFNQKRSDSESDRLGRFLFYNHDQRLQQGAYLSEAPPELVQLLNQVYERKTGHGLPYVFDATPIDCGHISPDTLPIQPKYRIEDFIEDSGFKRGQIEMWERRLRHKQHIVFQGPPGTGKTFVAKKLAQMMVSETDGFSTIVQFHPSYSYEDFMQGIRPQVADGKLFYDTKEGTFLKFCDAASKRNEKTPCILIIDEMNRAKLSRVFGELMYLLENRGEAEAIPLAYADEKRPSFAIPPNVYLIATMNTADRSIALVDHALRRRFSFIFLEPDYDVLRNYLVKHNLPSKQLPEVLEKMNARLIRDRHYQLGISYFMREDLKETIGDIWEGEIESYLDEYLYGKDIKIDPYRWINLCKDHLDEWSD
jgi:MoxR-like ATPase